MSGGSPRPDDLLKGIVTVAEPETSDSMAQKRQKLASNLERARADIMAGKLDSAISLLEESVTLDAKHREVLLTLVEVLGLRSRQVVQEDPARSYRLMVQAGGYLKSMKEVHSDFTSHETQMFANILFDEACAHARSKRQEEFSGALGAALDEGFADAERLANDPDLTEFRNIPEMNKLIEDAASTIKARSK